MDSSGRSSEPLLVGLAQVGITPSVGYREVDGYSEVMSTGIDDSLYAKAMLPQKGQKQRGIVVCDIPKRHAFEEGRSELTTCPLLPIAVKYRPRRRFSFSAN